MNKFLGLSLLSLPAMSMAQGQLTYGRPIVEAAGTVQYLISLLSIIIPSAAVVVFFFLVFLFIWKKVRGEEDKNGGKNLLWGVVALTVLFGLYGLIRLFGSVVGVNTDGSTRIVAPSLPSQSN